MCKQDYKYLEIEGLQLVFVSQMKLDLWTYQFMGGYLIGEFTCYMSTIFNKQCATREVQAQDLQ